VLVGKSKNIEKIKNGICPYCKRKLKPITTFEKGRGIDHLICRYCDLKIKKSDIRKENFPNKIDERYTIKQKKKIKKCIHSPVPNKCPFCESKKIREYPEDYTWECLNHKCEETFQWREFRVHFYGSITVVADSKEMASELAYERTGDLWTEVDEV
jgi:hypothetical protein